MALVGVRAVVQVNWAGETRSESCWQASGHSLKAATSIAQDRPPETWSPNRMCLAGEQQAQT